MPDYDKVGLLVVRNGRILLCRKRHGTKLLILPGGCREQDESSMACLEREIREELGNVSLRRTEYLGTYEHAAADTGKTVRIELYRGELEGVPAPHSEIAELVWFALGDNPAVLSPSLRYAILPDLAGRGILDGMSYRPEGFHSVTPYLIVNGAARLLEFVQQAFGADNVYRFDRPDGTIMHASFRIGDSMIECADARPEFPAMPTGLHLYVEDADAVYAKAIAAGATSLREPDDKPYGDREGDITDPCGNQWYIATHKEQVSEEEMLRRMSSEKQTA
jgi:PhnB protein